MKKIFIISAYMYLHTHVLLSNYNNVPYKSHKNTHYTRHAVCSKEDLLREERERIARLKRKQQAQKARYQRMVQIIELTLAITQRNKRIKELKENRNISLLYQRKELNYLTSENYADKITLMHLTQIPSTTN